jgi:hypothetical protein
MSKRLDDFEEAVYIAAAAEAELRRREASGAASELQAQLAAMTVQRDALAAVAVRLAAVRSCLGWNNMFNTPGCECGPCLDRAVIAKASE